MAKPFKTAPFKTTLNSPATQEARQRFEENLLKEGLTR